MLPHKCAGPPQLLQSAIQIDLGVRHLAPPLRGKDKERSNPAVYVNHMVRLRRPGLKRYVIKRLLAFIEIERQRLQHLCPLMECHRPQGRAALPARKLQHPPTR